MISKSINIILADDDKADCLLFQEALAELPVSTQLTIVHDGKKLMEALTQEGNTLPDVLFLDLNMPLKNGFASLKAIKLSNELQNIPVIIFSTSSEKEGINMVYRDAAHYYICKPNDFSKLKKVLYEALMIISQENYSLPLKENFMILGETNIIPEVNKDK
jgi:CheY-like chemotaxis protein